MPDPAGPDAFSDPWMPLVGARRRGGMRACAMKPTWRESDTLTSGRIGTGAGGVMPRGVVRLMADNVVNGLGVDP